MRKIIITISTFIFAAMGASYVGFYKSRSEENHTGGIYRNHPVNSGEKDSGYGFFRSSNDPLSPGNRPGISGGDGGIGEVNAPVGDGIIVPVVCCALMIAVKVIVAKRSKKKPAFPE